MPRTLPNRPDLDQLRRQAKDLLRAYRAGDHAAQQRFAHQLAARLRQPDRRMVFADGLAVIAREYGFTSWPRLKQHVEMLSSRPTTISASMPPRTTAYQQRIQQLAERVVATAKTGDIRQVFAALIVSARDGDAMRAYLVEHGQFTPVVDALLAAVDHPIDRVRFLVAQALDHFADQRCEQPLRRLMHDPVPRVRWAAIHSLGCEACKLAPLAQSGDLVADMVELALHDPSVKVRRVATYELGILCYDPRAIAALETIRAQSTDLTTRRNLARALERHRRTEHQDHE